MPACVEKANPWKRHTNTIRISDTSETQSRSVNSRDGTCLPLAERKYGGSQIDWLLQKDQVARIRVQGSSRQEPDSPSKLAARSDRALQ